MSTDDAPVQSSASPSSNVQASWQEKFIVEERFAASSTRRRLYVTALVLVVVGSTLLVGLMFSVLTHSGLQRLDGPVNAWFLAQRSPTLTSLMIVLAVVFGPVALPIIVLVVLLMWIIFAKHAWRPLLLAGGMVTGMILAKVIAPLVGHPRPPEDLMLFGADSSFSFPSGHVLGTADFLLILTFLVVSRRHSRKLTVLLFSCATAVILAQVNSRLYLGYHWLTDTAASIALSLVILGVLMAIDTLRTVRVHGEHVQGTHSQSQVDGT